MFISTDKIPNLRFSFYKIKYTVHISDDRQESGVSVPDSPDSHIDRKYKPGMNAKTGHRKHFNHLTIYSNTCQEFRKSLSLSIVSHLCFAMTFKVLTIHWRRGSFSLLNVMHTACQLIIVILVRAECMRCPWLLA